MHALKKLMLGSATAALAISAFGAPVAAADTQGTLAVVQGRPGPAVDICIGNKEQVSGARYGSVLQKDVISNGRKVLRFYAKNNKRKCGGTLLAKKVLTITPGSDFTVVLTRRNPKVVVFDNVNPTPLGEIPPRGAAKLGNAYAFRHAADFEADLHFTFWSPNPTYPIDLAAMSISSKGKQDTFDDAVPNIFLRIHATQPGATAEVAHKVGYWKVSRRYEYILVGSNAGNAKFVAINRGVSQPS